MHVLGAAPAPKAPAGKFLRKSRSTGSLLKPAQPRKFSSNKPQLRASASAYPATGPALDTLLGDDSDDDDDAPPLQAADVSDDDDAPPPPPYVYRPSQDDEFMIGALHLGRDSTLVRAPTPP